jgi:hypothetical protein
MAVETAAGGIDRIGFPRHAQGRLTAGPRRQLCLNRLGEQPPHVRRGYRDSFAAEAAGDGDAGSAEDAARAATRLPGWCIAGGQPVRASAWFAVGDVAIDERAASRRIPCRHRLEHADGVAGGHGQVDMRGHVGQEIKSGEYCITRRFIFGETAGRGAAAGLGYRRFPLRGADGEQRQHRVRAAEHERDW